MLDAEGAKNVWQWVDTTYIQPEAARRRLSGEISEEFKLYQFRVLMPTGQAAIVQFNEEVHWIAKAKRGDNKEFVPNTDVFIYELDRIESVEPPEVDGQRVAFIFFGWDGQQYKGFFDFTPNWPEEKSVAQGIAQDDSWAMNPSLTHFLQTRLEEKAARFCLLHKDTLRQLGLWLIPTLIPYPLALIAQHLSENNEESARFTFISFCNATFLENLIAKWWIVPEFEYRKPLIEESLWAHREGKYHLSISTLVPHIEGIIVHWEFNQGMNTRFTPESRIKDFKQKTQQETNVPFLYASVHEETTNFILSGPILATFKNWQDTLDPSFPNRHALGHGRYDQTTFTEEASIKIFLLLDTIQQLIAAQSIWDT